MQRMSYIFILYFYNQQSMQNQNYGSVSISEQFQPIEVELENGKQSKEVDFKLFVLLILIVFLGLLINKHEEQLETQSQTPIKTSPPQNTPQSNTVNPSKEIAQSDSLRTEENEESQWRKKQLYSRDKTLQQTDANSRNQKVASISKSPSILKQKQPNSTKESPSVVNETKNSQESEQNSKSQNSRPSQSSTTNTTTHCKLMRKYIEFYFWFPFFIFAVIIYTCYQKQHASSSMFIEVLKSNSINSKNNPEDCAICITQMRQQDLLAVLPCSSKHLFHSGCIKEWLAMKKTCPICRCDVRVARGKRG